MKIKHKALAALFGVAVAVGTASGAFASPHFTHVMTDPCAQVMNSPARVIVFYATPLSERGLQCPIQEDSGAPLE
jgi:hypothetical protein